MLPYVRPPSVDVQYPSIAYSEIHNKYDAVNDKEITSRILCDVSQAAVDDLQSLLLFTRAFKFRAPTDTPALRKN
jgi:hypothetical protein